MSDGNEHRYGGESLDIVWDGSLCIHVGECGRAKNDLFVGGRQPWCQPDLVSAEVAVEVVHRCPTGALSVERKDGGTGERSDDKNVIVVANNGPLYARGDLRIDGAPEGSPGTSFRAALCRCGDSKNKPFCDNSHEENGFRDRGAVGEPGSATGEVGGPLTIKRAKNGPLLLIGQFEIVASSGRVAWRGAKAALCRCGNSQNKPFCDGGHAKADFTAD
jgi:CDGSH-type Zn-finger protein/uncharacterized Fe-S cluster protein YjdI